MNDNHSHSYISAREDTRAPKASQAPWLVPSLCLNVTLVILLVWHFQRPSAPQPMAAVPASDTPPQTIGRLARTDAKPIAAPAVTSLPWQQVESTDLVVYAENLRAAGCPPKTARDILLPWIEENFAPSDTLPSTSTHLLITFSERRAAAAARTEQQTALRQEQDQAARALLGFAWTSEGLRESYSGNGAGPLGFLDYEKAEQLLCIEDHLKLELSAAERSHRSERRSAVYKTWRQEAAAVVSPAELEEIELRLLLVAYQRQNPTVCNAGLSGLEMRQLMMFRSELFDPQLSVSFAKGDEVVRETGRGAELQFEAKARTLLGDFRFIDFLKTSDKSIERTLWALEKEHLPRSMALKLFDLRQEALARAAEIRKQSLHRAEKRTELAALRENALEQLAGLSEAGTESPLVRLNETWLQEIANP